MFKLRAIISKAYMVLLLQTAQHRAGLAQKANMGYHCLFNPHALALATKITSPCDLNPTPNDSNPIFYKRALNFWPLFGCTWFGPDWLPWRARKPCHRKIQLLVQPRTAQHLACGSCLWVLVANRGTILTGVVLPFGFTSSPKPCHGFDIPQASHKCVMVHDTVKRKEPPEFGTMICRFKQKRGQQWPHHFTSFKVSPLSVSTTQQHQTLTLITTWAQFQFYAANTENTRQPR